MRMRHRPVIVGALAAATVLIGISSVAAAGTAGGAAVTTASTDTPPPAVEDFIHPGAEQILKDRNLVLKRGDGHILLADCVDGQNLIEVWARGRDERVCFKVTGTGGFLELELPKVVGIRGNDYTTKATAVVKGTEKTFDIAKNGPGEYIWTPIGEASDPDQNDHMLLRLVAHR
ncbi:hypothetical protein [Kitasatospora sp. NPDC001547]|uniref:hypothetical protein n=1 Tax=Kitasatospora sp. NPDC001547 TaxID=3364015 RepID=UPI00367982C3